MQLRGRLRKEILVHQRRLHPHVFRVKTARILFLIPDRRKKVVFSLFIFIGKKLLYISVLSMVEDLISRKVPSIWTDFPHHLEVPEIYIVAAVPTLCEVLLGLIEYFEALMVVITCLCLYLLLTLGERQ